MNSPAAELPVWSVLPSGDRCLAVVFEGDLAHANWRAHTAAQRLRDAQLAGVIEIVPGMVSVAVHYASGRVGAPAPGRVTARASERVEASGPAQTSGDAKLPYASLAEQVEAVLQATSWGERGSPRVVTLPVCYGGECGPDLEFVAKSCGLTADEVVCLHAGTPLDVFMLGFAPGHPYMGTLDARLSIGRRATPRTAVPAGSVAIANRQSNVYPAQLPGGWHILGRTPLAMFDPKREPPCLLDAGDRVHFVPIDANEFEMLRREHASRHRMRDADRAGKLLR
jgi:KipI family sensor histidine kinase inhibitor